MVVYLCRLLSRSIPQLPSSDYLPKKLHPKLHEKSPWKQEEVGKFLCVHFEKCARHLSRPYCWQQCIISAMFQFSSSVLLCGSVTDGRGATTGNSRGFIYRFLQILPPVYWRQGAAELLTFIITPSASAQAEWLVTGVSLNIYLNVSSWQADSEVDGGEGRH